VIPVAASLVGEAHRGRIIGNVMSGLMIGILLSRPLASLAADAFGWRGAYALDAIAVAAVALALQRVLPQRPPAAGATYSALIASLRMLLADALLWRRPSLLRALGWGASAIFGAAAARRLTPPPFGLDPVGIALFTLAGVGGAVIAPIAGWAGDRGWTTRATRIAH